MYAIRSYYAGGAETVAAEKSTLSMMANTDALSSVEPVNAAVASVTDLNVPGDIAELRLTDDADTELRLKPRKLLSDIYTFPREKRSTTIMTGLTGMMASIDNMTSAAQGVSLGVYVEQQLTRVITSYSIHYTKLYEITANKPAGDP